MSAAPKVHLDRDGRARCGGGGAENLPVTADETAVTCGRCKHILAGINYGGIQWYHLKAHGTNAAVRRHYRRREKRCPACKQYEQRKNADRYRGAA